MTNRDVGVSSHRTDFVLRNGNLCEGAAFIGRLFCFRWDGSSRGDACGDGGHLSRVALIGHACALGGLVDVPLYDADVTAAQELNQTLPELKRSQGREMQRITL